MSQVDSTGDIVEREQGQPSLRRLTSTTRHPMRGLPLPSGLAAQRSQRLVETVLGKGDPSEWHAALRKVEWCLLSGHNSGKGLESLHEYSPEREDRCYMQCHGDLTLLTIELRVLKSRRDPQPMVLKSFTLPDDARLLDIRLFEDDVCIELRETPKNRKDHTGECWVIKLDVSLSPESVLKDSKMMLRRFESVTSKMPADWFSYRNFSSSRQNSGIQHADAFLHHHVGGYKWRFTGHLAGASFAEALGEAPARGSTVDDLAPGQAIAQITRASQGRKAARLAPKKLRRSKRVSEREARKRATEAASPPPTRRGPAPISNDRTEVADEEEWEVIGILDSRSGKKGKTMYLIRWEGDYQPTWEPEENVAAETIEEFETNGPCEAPAAATSGESSEDDDSSSEPSVAPKRGRRKPASGKQPRTRKSRAKKPARKSPAAKPAKKTSKRKSTRK